MENIEKLKELIEPVLKELDLEVYDLKWLSGKDKVLQVMITNNANNIDIDTCALASEKIGEILDKEDPIPSEYTLEVCSPGAEREIKDIKDLLNLKDGYICIKLKEPMKSMMEITGEVIDTGDHTITLEYRDKAAKRKIEIDLDNISFARFAVRI